MADELSEEETILAGRAPEERQLLFAEVFLRHRHSLRQMVDLRLGPDLRKLVDPSDVVQECFLDAVKRLEEYLTKLPLPIYNWLRFLTRQRLAELRRRLVPPAPGAVQRAVSLDATLASDSSAAALASRIVGSGRSPLEAVLQAELQERVRHALDALETIDREILVLRHVEGLTGADVARELEINEAAARQRYVRALRRFRRVLGERGGMGSEPWL